MKTRSQTARVNIQKVNQNKRISRKVVRLIDEYDKYTSGRYHGWRDTYEREYNTDDMYHINIDSDEEDEYHYKKRKEVRFIPRVPDTPMKRKKMTKEGYDTSDGFIVNDNNDVNWADYENEL